MVCRFMHVDSEWGPFISISNETNNHLEDISWRNLPCSEWMTISVLLGECLGIVVLFATLWGVWKVWMNLISYKAFSLSLLDIPSQVGLLWVLYLCNIFLMLLYGIYDLLPSVFHCAIILIFLSPESQPGKDMDWFISEFPKVLCSSTPLSMGSLRNWSVLHWSKCQKQETEAPLCPQGQRKLRFWASNIKGKQIKKKNCVIILYRIMGLTEQHIPVKPF